MKAWEVGLHDDPPRARARGIRDLPRMFSLLFLMERFDVGVLGALLVLSGQGRQLQGVRETLGHFGHPGEDVGGAFTSGVNEALSSPRLMDALREYLPLLRDNGFPFSARLIENSLADTGDERSRLAERLPELEARVRDELDALILFRVPVELCSLVDQPSLFGDDVATRFPDAQHDISEAGNCRALGLNTAAVFHLMRAMEVALKAIAKALGIPDPTNDAERNWGRMLYQVKAEIDRRTKAADPGWGIKRSFFDGAYAQLWAVKTAWRNPVMHVDAKHDEADAKRIYDAVKGFMEHLAAGLA